MYKGPLLLTVSAISGGGKTAVVKALTKVFKRAAAFYFDDYEYTRHPENIGCWIENGSNPDAWDLTLIENDVKQAVQSGEYDYIFVDYPFGKKEDYALKPLVDIAVFIDTPPDIALVRRVLRDQGDANAKDIILKLTAYLSIRKYFIYTDKDKKDHDFIIDGARPISEITEMMKEKIESVYRT